MKTLRSFSLVTAFLVVLLHSLVPHNHHQGVGDTIVHHTNPENLIEQIALGFHVTQTDGQLEEFNSGDDIQIPDLFAAVNQTSVQFFSEENSIFESVDVPLICKINQQSLNRRGPPAI